MTLENPIQKVLAKASVTLATMDFPSLLQPSVRSVIEDVNKAAKLADGLAKVPTGWEWASGMLSSGKPLKDTEFDVEFRDKKYKVVIKVETTLL